MAGRRGLGRLAAILTLGGGLLSHALDEEGMLPGVRESREIREFAERGAAKPLLLLGCVAIAAAVGYAVARRPRSPRALLALVVGGQAAMFASFEVATRLAAGLDVAEVFVEPNFVSGVVVQVLIAAAFVTAVLLAGRRALRALALPASPWQPVAATRAVSSASVFERRRVERPEQGRAPPRAAVPVPTL